MIDGFERIEKDLYNVRAMLLSSSEIRKLLVYTSPNALESIEPSVSQASPFIFLSPVFKTNQEPYNKTTFISITISESSYNKEEAKHDVDLRINIFSKTENWELDNGRIRVLAIASEVIKKLHAKKLKSSQKLEYISTAYMNIDENYQGYSLLFTTIDGGGLENEF